MFKFRQVSTHNILWTAALLCVLVGCSSTATGVQNPPASLTPVDTATALATAVAQPTNTPTLTKTPVPPSPTVVEPTPTATATATSTPTLAPATATPTTEAATVMPTNKPTDEPASTPTVLNNALPVSNMAEKGLQVYQEQYCGLCHQLDVAGTLGRFGPPHNHVATTAQEHLNSANYSGNASTVAEYFRESILNPEIYIVDGYAITSHKMPAYTHLSDEEVEALVQFLLEQK